MTDFFGALELELRAAAERRPRRAVGVGQALGVGAAAALVAAALAVTLTVMGGGGDAGQPEEVTGARQPAPVGTVIPKGEGEPPRVRRSTVVATGRHPAIGPWQLETYRSERLANPETDEELQPAGLRCLMVYLLDPPGRHHWGASGQCGEFSRTPGFSRLQHGGVQRGEAAVLLYGRVPRRATSVRVLVPGRRSIPARIHEGPKASGSSDFYSVVLRGPLPRASVQWFGATGEPGSRGIRLMPPLSR